MGDDSSRGKKSILKQEWNLFWQSLLEDESKANAELPPIEAERIGELIKSLSQDRKKLNQKLEVINREIEDNTHKLESLKLVGSDTEETQSSISQMNDEGEKLSKELERVNRKLDQARKWQEQARGG